MVDQISNLEASLLCSGTTMLLAMQHLLVFVIHSEPAKIRRSANRVRSGSCGRSRKRRSIPATAWAPIKQFLWCCRSAPRELGQDRRD